VHDNITYKKKRYHQKMNEWKWVSTIKANVGIRKIKIEKFFINSKVIGNEILKNYLPAIKEAKKNIRLEILIFDWKTN
jgi:hypothetical protein